MNKLFAFSLALVLLASCNGQGTIKAPDNPEELLAAEIKRADSLAKSSIAFNLDEIPSGIRYPEMRVIDKANSPVTLNIPASQGTIKPLALSALFNSVRYVVLDFGKDSALAGKYTEVLLVGDGYATTSLFSLCYFGADGKLKKVLGKNESGVMQFPSGISYSPQELKGVSPNATAKGDRIIYTLIDMPKKQVTLNVFDTKRMALVFSAPRYYGNYVNITKISQNLLTDDSWVEYHANIDPLSKHKLCLYGPKGDTLTAFKNNLRGADTKGGSIADPDGWFRYEYNGQLTIRQPYADTVFRFHYPNILEACYVLDFGKNMVDIQAAIQVKMENKYVPSLWIETNGHIVMGYSKNYDCPNNRNANKVKFYYAAYDKKTNALFHIAIPATNEMEAYLSNDIDGGIPFGLGSASVNNVKGVMLLSREQLNSLATEKSTSYLPKANRDAAGLWASKLKSGQQLVIIYE